MFQGDYAQLPRPEAGIHSFLMTLATEETSKINPGEIARIAQDLLKETPVLSSTTTTHEKIFMAAKMVMDDAVGMSGLYNAKKEIIGAINGLYVLLQGESDKSKEQVIRTELNAVEQWARQIQGMTFDVALIEKATDDPALKAITKNSDFLSDFGLLMSLYGRTRNIDNGVVVSVIKAWLDPNIQPLIGQFVKAAVIAKAANLQILESGHIPKPEATHNQKLTAIESTLKQTALPNIEGRDDRSNFSALIGDLFNRAMVTNSQIHSDGLGLVFNSEAADTLSSRQKGKDDYVAGSGFYLQKSEWKPLIGPQDPISAVARTVGFRTREGETKETTIQIDFAIHLGPDKLNLLPAEREMLTKLLKKCDSAVLKDDEVMTIWREDNQVPKEIANIVLREFDRDDFPNLKELTRDQRRGLVGEALRFAFDVNYHLAINLLNLGS